MLTRERHRFLWHCSRCAARSYISPIPVYCLPRLHASNVNRFNERKQLHTGKGKKQKIPAQTIIDLDYTDNIALLANTPTQAEYLQHSLEQAAGGIGLQVNADKTEYMCFNQRGDISTLNGDHLKLMDKFTYQGNSISSTENDINMWLAKAWTAINRLSVIWKSDLSNKIKCSFLQAVVVSILLYGCSTWTLTKRMEKKLDDNYTRMLRAVLNKSWRQDPTKQQLYGHLPPRGVLVV